VGLHAQRNSQEGLHDPMITLSGQNAAFLANMGVKAEGWRQLPADASSRRYYRNSETPFGPALLMVTGAEAPEFKAYVQIGRHLENLGLSAPQIYAEDASLGLALIEDFSDQTYTKLLNDGWDEAALYELAIDVLATLHEHPKATGVVVPFYDMEPLIKEANLLSEWFAPEAQRDANLVTFGAQYEALWRDALSDVAARQDTLVLRDFHVDNLILLNDRSGAACCGLLDFQDGLIGSFAYDVMSLAQDARRDLSDGLESHLLQRYFNLRPELDQKSFLQDFYILAAQRHAKVAGIFLRLSRRDGKDTYLRHIPRVLRLLDRALHAAGLDELKEFLDTSLPGWRDFKPAPNPKGTINS
jgi:N-acetylmuramate 1-kinase